MKKKSDYISYYSYEFLWNFKGLNIYWKWLFSWIIDVKITLVVAKILIILKERKKENSQK